jgi:hypothetical protein
MFSSSVFSQTQPTTNVTNQLFWKAYIDDDLHTAKHAVKTVTSKPLLINVLESAIKKQQLPFIRIVFDEHASLFFLEFSRLHKWLDQMVSFCKIKELASLCDCLLNTQKPGQKKITLSTFHEHRQREAVTFLRDWLKSLTIPCTHYADHNKTKILKTLFFLGTQQVLRQVLHICFVIIQDFDRSAGYQALPSVDLLCYMDMERLKQLVNQFGIVPYMDQYIACSNSEIRKKILDTWSVIHQANTSWTPEPTDYVSTKFLDIQTFLKITFTMHEQELTRLVFWLSKHYTLPYTVDEKTLQHHPHRTWLINNRVLTFVQPRVILPKDEDSHVVLFYCRNLLK